MNCPVASPSSGAKNGVADMFCSLPAHSGLAVRSGQASSPSGYRSLMCGSNEQMKELWPRGPHSNTLHVRVLIAPSRRLRGETAAGTVENNATRGIY